MSSMLKKNFLDALYRANFNKIINYVLNICELVVEDYQQKKLKMPNDENKIRSIVLEEYLTKQKKAYGMSNYRFEPETLENYVGKGKHIGRVDIRILLKSAFEKDEAYYIIECKRIDGTSELNKQYVKEGVARFVTQKYSSYYGRNLMLGFVVKRIDVSANAQSIEKIQNVDSDEKMHGNFELVTEGGISKSYKCLYQIQSGELELRHIFSDYSSII